MDDHNSLGPDESPSCPAGEVGCFLCSPDHRLIYWRSANFIALSGLGPVTPGYSLISTAAHTKSMADVDSRHTLERADALRLIRNRLSRVYKGPCLVTEHGRVPLCRDEDDQQHDAHCFHAHFLVFPCAPDISSLVATYFAHVHKFQKLDDAMEHAAAFSGYVLISPRVDEFSIFTGPLNLPRQLARKLVAHAIGRPDLANWRSQPNWDATIHTALSLIENFRGVRNAE